MRIIVLSDSHGNSYNIRQALYNHPEADRIIFLGDGEKDFHDMDTEIAGRPITMVRGNCDSSFSLLPENELERINGHLILITHGYTEHVKYGIDELISKASVLKADIVLFGHTHEQYADYEDGIYIMNPGSINEYQYGIIDIVPGGVMLLKENLRD